MDWIKVSIYTTAEGIEPVCGNLYLLGIGGVEIEDEKDFTDFLEENRQYWDYVDDGLIKQKHKETSVSVYLGDNAYGREMLLSLKDAMARLKEFDKDEKFGRLEVSLGNVKEEDWANNWKKYFHPIEIGEKILIRPEWEEVKEDGGRIVFSIDPGMTFGTGSHYTTRLCLEAAEKYVDGSSKVLDIGCGSGILSVISLMLGAKSALAADIDPNCIKVFDKNAARNGIQKERYEVIAGNVITDTYVREKILKNKYSVIFANIVADVIIDALPLIKSASSPGTVFIASGIISDREQEVSDAVLSCGFEILETNRLKDWTAIVSRYNG